MCCDGGRRERELWFVCVYHHDEVNNKCGDLEKVARRKGQRRSTNPDSFDKYKARRASRA